MIETTISNYVDTVSALNANTVSTAYDVLITDFENIKTQLIPVDAAERYVNLYFSVSTSTKPSITNMGKKFQNCQYLVRICSDPFKYGTSAAEYCFQGCQNLESVELDFSEFAPMSMSYCFENCPKITKFVFGNGIQGAKYMYSKTAITEVKLDSYTVNDASYMFKDCSSLKKAYFKTNNAQLSGLFSGCQNLETVEYLSGSNITLSSVFNGCSNLTSINFQGLDFSKTTSASYIFKNCSSLTSIDLSEFTKLTDCYGMLQGCSSLTSISSANFPLVKNADNIFENCTGLTEVKDLDLPSLTRGSYLFQGCSGLETVEINCPVMTTGSNMFNGCQNLKTVEINCPVMTTTSYMFQGCSSLTSIDLSQFPAMTTASYMFQGCSSLEAVLNPDFSKITSFYNTFANCSSLKELDFSSATKLNSASQLLLNTSLEKLKLPGAVLGKFTTNSFKWATQPAEIEVIFSQLVEPIETEYHFIEIDFENHQIKVYSKDTVEAEAVLERSIDFQPGEGDVFILNGKIQELLLADNLPKLSIDTAIYSKEPFSVDGKNIVKDGLVFQVKNPDAVFQNVFASKASIDEIIYVGSEAPSATYTKLWVKI